MDTRLALLLLGAALGALGIHALGRLVRRLRLGWRTGRARRLEADAAGLLARAGYTVVAEQVTETCSVTADGELHAPVVRADYLVTRRGRTWVAEAKSGAKAPDVRDRATRRQLLEYAVTYNVDGVLLVDTERGRVIEVAFPGLRRAGRGFWTGVAVGALVVGAAGILWARG